MERTQTDVPPVCGAKLIWKRNGPHGKDPRVIHRSTTLTPEFGESWKKKKGNQIKSTLIRLLRFISFICHTSHIYQPLTFAAAISLLLQIGWTEKPSYTRLAISAMTNCPSTRISLPKVRQYWCLNDRYKQLVEMKVSSISCKQTQQSIDIKYVCPPSKINSNIHLHWNSER